MLDIVTLVFFPFRDCIRLQFLSCDCLKAQKSVIDPEVGFVSFALCDTAIEKNLHVSRRHGVI